MTDGLWVTTDTAEIDALAADLAIAHANATSALVDLRGARLRVLGVSETPDGARLLALGAIERALFAVTTVQTRTRDRTAALREATRAYDGAEAGAESSLDLLPWALPFPFTLAGTVAGVVGPLVRDLVTGAPVFPASRAERLVDLLGFDHLAEITQIVSPYLPAGFSLSVGPHPVTPLLPALGVLRPTRIALQPPGQPLAPAAAASLADIADRVRLANDAAGAGAGEAAVVDVQKIEHVDGTTSWTVAVHGTKGLHPAQPYHVAQNVGAYTGLGSAGESVVVAAMEEAGIGPGEAVLLAGHSQGGMTMARLATNRDFQRRFTVGGVVTFGAPVAHIPAPPPTVVAAHLQHAEEGIAGLSGDGGARDGGPAPNEVVVVRELTGTGAAVGGLAAHDMSSYVVTAGLAEAEPHPALGDWRRGMEPLLAEPGATVTATTYRGSTT